MKTVTGKYYQVEKLPSAISDLVYSLSFFHLNISSLRFHFEQLYTFLKSNKNQQKSFGYQRLD